MIRRPPRSTIFPYDALPIFVKQLNPGTYYIRVAGYYSTSTGSYQLHVEGPGAGTWSDDHTSGPQSATPVAIGILPRGTIDVSRDQDYFVLTVTNSGWYWITTRGTTDTYG